MNLLVYLPLTWPSISSKVFTSFLDMVGPAAQPDLQEMGVNLSVLINDSFPLCRNRNQAVELAMSSKYEADAILFADADQVWPKDTIRRLLEHLTDETPVVSGIYFRKTPPHTCVAGHYSGWDRHETKRASLEANGFVTPAGEQCLFYKPLKDFDTIQPIDVSGMGCLLVKTDVFKRLDLPYFQYVNCFTTHGDYTIDHCSEEMVFWAQLKKNGIKALVVPSVRCGHVLEKVVGCAEN